MKRLALAIVVAFAFSSVAPGGQFRPGAEMRIVVLVDSSAAVGTMLTSFRAGLKAFLDGLPGTPEIAIVSTGGQPRVRIVPTTDRVRLRAIAEGFASDGGGNVLMDAILEADQRFLKSEPARRSVFVILTTDTGTTANVNEGRVAAFNAFVPEFVKRGGRAHAVVVAGVVTSITTEVAQSLAENTSGFYDQVTVASAVPKAMTTLAGHVAADQ